MRCGRIIYCAAPAPSPFGPRSKNIILPQHFKHAGPHIARHARQAANRVHKGGQGQMPRQIAKFAPRAQLLVIHGCKARNGQPLQLDAKNIMSSRASRERGHDTARAPTPRNRRSAFPAHDGGERRISQLGLHADARLSDTLALQSKVYLNRFFDDRFVRYSETTSSRSA